jgi:hypothetical protein
VRVTARDVTLAVLIGMEPLGKIAAPKRAVCVLGMHRSGNSVVAELVRLVGTDLSPEGSTLNLNRDDQGALCEHGSIVALNDEILSRFKGAWDAPPAFPDGWGTSPMLADLRQRVRTVLAADLGDSAWWAWQDPRTCLTIPFWQQLLPSIDYVLCVRDPLAVTHSLQQSDGFSMEKSARLWLAYTASALRHTSRQRRLIVFYEDVMRDANRVLKQIAAFLERPLIPAIDDRAREFLTDDRVHHPRSTASIVDEAGVEFPAKSLYLTLRALHGKALSEPDWSALDAAVDLYSAQAIDYQARVIGERDLVQTLVSERDLVRDESTGLQKQLAQAEGDIRVLTTARDVANRRLRAAQSGFSQSHTANGSAAEWRAWFRESFRPARTQLATRESSRDVRHVGRGAKLLELHRLPRTSAWKATLALLAHPSRLRDVGIIGSSRLFDPAYYLQQYPDVVSSQLPPVLHFVEIGAAEGRRCHPLFDPAWYQSRIQPGALQDRNPIVHYLLHGAREGLDPHPLFSSAHYSYALNGAPMIADNPLVDYLIAGALELRAPHPLFDPVHYLDTYPDVRNAGVEPLTHFLLFGAAENRSPNPFFDCEFYKTQAPEIVATGINPLVHFLQQGWRNRLNPSPAFDTNAYLLEYPDVLQAKMNPLAHYLSHGQFEGRGIARVGSRTVAVSSSFKGGSGATNSSHPSHHGNAPLTCRRFALYTASLGNYFFEEIRDLLAAGLRELGFSVEIRDERQGFSHGADWHLVVAPHEFFYLGAGNELRERAPSGLILFNTEQPSTQWFALAKDCFDWAYAVWDISFESAKTISEAGYRCSYLPLGYSPGFAAAREVTELPDNYGTRALPHDIKSRPVHMHALAERPIDVLFVGHSSPRRERFFAQSARILSKHRCYLHFSSVAAPVVPGRTTHMDTTTVMGLAQRSRILLNVHHGSDIYFEWHRIVIEGIWQRALVITEPCGVAPPFTPGLDFVEAPLDEIPALVDYHLSTGEGRRTSERIVEHGFRTLTERCRLRDSLRRLILALHDVPDFPGGFLRERHADGPFGSTLVDHRAASAVAHSAGISRMSDD